MQTSIILPALDEAANLDWLLPLLVAKFAVVVVDNGSKDNTAAITLKHGASLVTCAERGYGRAVLAGIDYVRQWQLADIIVICDADGSSPIEHIQDMVYEIDRNQADLVICQRTLRQKGSAPIHARLGNRLTLALIRLATARGFTDLGPLRALRMAAMERLGMKDTTWGWNVEMQMKAVWQGLTIVELPSSYYRRRFGSSKISGSLMGSLRAGSKMLWRVVYFYGEYKGRHILEVFKSSRKKLVQTGLLRL